MEQQIEARAGFSPPMQQRAERDQSERFRAGRLSGKIEGFLAGELSAKREVVLRLAARAGISLTATEHARVLACADRARLDRWIDSAMGATSAADLLA